MGTEVLRPQDCLTERIRVPPPAVFARRRRHYGNQNHSNHYYNNYYGASSRPYRKPTTRPERPDPRKRVVVGLSQQVLKRSSADDSRTAKSSGLVMEKVTILRRGESLDSLFKSSEASDTVVSNHIRIADARSDVYAGSAFAVSPSPSALPLPSFQKKKQASAVVDDSATRDLRRLLRLE